MQLSVLHTNSVILSLLLEVTGKNSKKTTDKEMYIYVKVYIAE